MCLFIDIVDAVKKQEEDAGEQWKSAAGDCHPVAPGEVRVVVGERRRTVIAIGKTTEHSQRCCLNYNCMNTRRNNNIRNYNNNNNNNNIGKTRIIIGL